MLSVLRHPDSEERRRAPIGRYGPVNSLGQVVRALVIFGLMVLLIAIGTQRQAQAQTAQSGPSFTAFIQSLWPQAQARGVSRQTFDTAFAGVTSPSPSILKHTRRQAEFVKPPWDYIAGAVSAQRIDRGRARAAEFSETLTQIEQRYGVDAYVVLAIWGLETSYGSFTGGENVIRSLATLAHARYRGDFFREELLTALQILQQGHITVSAMSGSWAGAMGQTQFMPSSFMKYAVDYNGDGRKNIWTNIPEALASTANYLAQFGWVRGETWGYEVILPQGYDVSPHDPAKMRSFAQWRADNIRRADGEPMPTGGEASLLLPTGVKGPAFLMTRNFRVIKAYNQSTLYALSVGILSDRIAGAAPLQGKWPKQEKLLSVSEVKELQQRLARLGFDVGEVDGKVGDRVQTALRAWQRRVGVMADGHPTPAMLERMRNAR